MQAYQVNNSTAEASAAFGEMPTPVPGAGQLLIEIHAAGVIATELLWYPTTHRENGDPRLNAIPGHEFSGTVASVGDGAGGFVPGDEVYGMNSWFWEGAVADYCLTVPSSIALKPKSLTHIEAATVPISALTAWQGLFDRAAVQPGERVLVQGGAGAVGLFVVQLAHRHGAHITATASREHFPLLRSLGADEMIDYKASRFEDGLAPVDVVFDTVGGGIGARSTAVLKRTGRMVSIAAGDETSTDPIAKAAFFIVEPNHTQLVEIGRLLDQGKLKTFVKGVVALKDAGLAYTGGVPGKGAAGKFVVEMESQPSVSPTV